MGAFDIIVIVVVALAFLAVVGSELYKKVTGKQNGCGYDCSQCSGHCKNRTPKNSK